MENEYKINRFYPPNQLKGKRYITCIRLLSKKDDDIFMVDITTGTGMGEGLCFHGYARRFEVAMNTKHETLCTCNGGSLVNIINRNEAVTSFVNMLRFEGLLNIEA